ncbi:MAG: phosphatase PAP2 family protein [Planctomycetaceae bacterium]
MIRPPLLQILPWTLAAVLLIGLAFVCGDVLLDGPGRSFEERIIAGLRDAADPQRMIGPRLLEESMRDITALGGYAVLLMVSFCFAIFCRLELSRESFRFFVLTVTGGFLFNLLIKELVQRGRPDVVPHLSFVRGSTSFPSAHAMMSVIVYVTIGLLLSTRTRDRHLQRLFSVFPLWLAGVIGISRVCMGVHYPTDVLAGWMLGLVCTWLAFRIRNRIMARQETEGR